MNPIENLLCIFCRNSTIISTEKPQNYIYNKSNDDEKNNVTNLYSICTLCNKYSYIQPNTLLYNENFLKINSILTDIKYDPKLITIDMYCKKCEKETEFKMFAEDNFDLQYKYICTNCDTFYL